VKPKRSPSKSNKPEVRIVTATDGVKADDPACIENPTAHVGWSNANLEILSSPNRVVMKTDGSLSGSLFQLEQVVSKDPIRRVYSAGGGMIVETRQRRAVVQGVTTWWE
jgi:hypothetical protein